MPIKKIKNRPVRNILAMIVPTMLLIIFFCLIFRWHVSADSGETAHSMTSVESILVKKGDTLTYIAQKYASEFSDVSTKEYMNQIRSLNNMKSDYIQAGNYILLPNYRS